MTYTYDQKKKQKDRIEKLNNKHKYLRILSIITKHNKNIKLSNNDNGVFIFYHNLNEGTYKAIEKYLNKNEKKRIKIEFPKPYNNNPFEDMLDVDDPFEGTKMKYTAREKRIIISKRLDEVIFKR